MDTDLIGEEVTALLDRDDFRDPGRAGEALPLGREPERRAVLGLLDAIDRDRLAAGLDRFVVVAEDEITSLGHDAFADPVGFVLGAKWCGSGQDEHRSVTAARSILAPWLPGGSATRVARRHGAAPPPGSGVSVSRIFRLVLTGRRGAAEVPARLVGGGIGHAEIPRGPWPRPLRR